MSKNIIKTFCLILFICFPSIVFSQTTTISNEERLRLEEKFKELKTFYIDKDGLVVYTVANKSDSANVAAKSAVSTDESVSKVKVSVDASGGYVVTTEEAELPVVDYNTVSTDEKREADFERNQHVDVYAKSTEVVDDVFVDDTQVEVIPKEKSEKIPTRNTARKKSLQPKKSTDTTIAELEDLIGELKAQQNSNKQRNSKSMSNTISRSVDGSLRQKYSHNLSGTNVNEVKELDNYGSEENVGAESGSEDPIYYIDGVRVSVEEFLKLKPESIRRKDIRRSKTNAQGEWWIQTK